MPKQQCLTCELDFQPDLMATSKRCKGCHRAALRAARIQKTYSITEEQYQALLTAQQGGCYICHRKAGARRHSVDHDHSCCNGPISCGKCVRGLLCNKCNKFLGHIRDSVAAAYRMADYLAAPPAQGVLGRLTE